MVNINLTTSSLESKKEGFSYKTSISLVVVLLIIVVLAYAAIIVYTKKLAKDDAGINSAYAEEYDNLTRGNAKDVYDFQNRIEFAQSAIAGNNSVLPGLQEIEKTLVSDVYLESYAYDSKTGSISLACVGDNFGDIAKQIVSFKNSTYFSGVEVGETKLDEKKVSFEMSLKTK